MKGAKFASQAYREAVDSFEAACVATQWDRAEKIAFAYLGQSADDPDGHGWAVTALARAALGRGDRRAARDWLDRAARLIIDQPNFREYRAALLLELGDLAACRALLRRDGEDHAARLNEGVTLCLVEWLSGDRDGALQLLSQLLHRHLITLEGNLAEAATLMAHDLPGWFGHQGDHLLTGRLTGVDQIDQMVRLSGGEGQSLWQGPVALFRKQWGIAGSGFRLPLAMICTDPLAAAPFSLTLDGRKLIGDGLGLGQSLSIDGEVALEGDLLTGWVCHPEQRQRPPSLHLIGDDGKSFPLTLTPGRDPQNEACFRLEQDLAAIPGLPSGFLRLLAAPGEQPLAGSPLLWRAREPEPGPRPTRRSPIVDIILPVYGGRADSLACLDSLWAAGGNPPFELIVVDDASPDPVLREALDGLAASGRITLIRNRVNLGFPASVNRGMALHPDRDVLLLNADTLVFGDFLARLRRAADSAADIGTVTPLSNQATICSYPRLEKGDDKVPTAEEMRGLDQLAAQINRDRRVEIPTAVGFCMYIRRDCLSDCGLFREALFGRGYGEENEFCRRAATKNWRHLAAGDVYVGHVGGASFGPSRRRLMQRNAAILEKHHPGYEKLIEDFIAADRLSPLRRSLDLARWSDGSAGDCLLLVTFDLIGGATQHVAKRMASLGAAGWRVLQLVPGTAGNSRLIDPAQKELRDLQFDLREQSEMDLLLALLRRTGARAIEIHHSLHHPSTLLSLPARSGLPYDVVLHDYHWLCPQVTLIDATGRYCGEPDIAGCEACRAELGSESGEDISVAALRARSGALLLGARQVIAPSEDVARRYRRYFPALRPRVTPWDDMRPPPPNPRPAQKGKNRRVAVIGGLGPHKGYDLVLACARDAARRDLPLEFRVIGYSSDDSALFASERVFVTGYYQPEEAEALIRAQEADIAFLPSLCPETWCYGLSLAWQAGLRVVSLDIGAQAERIRGQRGGAVLPLDWPPERINDRLIALSTNGCNDAIPTEFKQTLAGDPFMPAQNAATITTIAQEMALPPGFYSVTVVKGGHKLPTNGQMALPSIQIGTAPGAAPVELLSNLAGGWLTQVGDTVLLKVVEATTLLLTSYKNAQTPQDTLDIQFARIDSAAASVLAPVVTAPPAPKLVMVAHIERLGDQNFNTEGWAGALGQNLAIEGLGFVPESGISADEIEYKAVAVNGWETPWFPGGSYCGTRHQALPLIGLAVRLKGQAAERFDVNYEVAFVGGTRGSSANGGICRSDVIGAPMEAVNLSVTAKV